MCLGPLHCTLALCFWATLYNKISNKGHKNAKEKKGTYTVKRTIAYCMNWNKKALLPLSQEHKCQVTQFCLVCEWRWKCHKSWFGVTNKCQWVTRSDLPTRHGSLPCPAPLDWPSLVWAEPTDAAPLWRRGTRPWGGAAVGHAGNPPSPAVHHELRTRGQRLTNKLGFGPSLVNGVIGSWGERDGRLRCLSTILPTAFLLILY